MVEVGGGSGRMEDVTLPAEIDAAWLQRFRRNLVRWYERNARPLPWRLTDDPYAIWLSEIMLQQTTVEAVKSYYARFLERFPTVGDLAAADEQDVLALWAGLGYYSRARNLRRAARMVVDEFGGRFPADPAVLQKLPGIGRYTAGAIASFAFDRPAPIVEANTLRLYSRLLGYRGDPRSGEGQRLLWEFARRLLPRNHPGRLNQALIEIGGRVCRPRDPDCDSCPVRNGCRAAAEGAQAEIPLSARKPEIEARTEATIAVTRDGRYLLRQQPPGEWWAGLWDFPRISISAEPNEVGNGRRKTDRQATANGNPQDPSAGELEAALQGTTGIEAVISRRVGEFRYSVTRYRIHRVCWIAEHGGGPETDDSDYCWVTHGEMESLPMTAPGRKTAEMLPAGGIS